MIDLSGINPKLIKEARFMHKQVAELVRDQDAWARLVMSG
jgi:hypothetical protein